MHIPSLYADAHGTAPGFATGLHNSALCVSIVCAIDGVRFAAAAANEQDCLIQVGSYVAKQARWQLWPASAHLVGDLLASGDVAAAVEEYFRRAGERWEPEWLVTTWLSAAPRSRAWSGTVPVPERFATPDGWPGGVNR